ncbi:Uncharacterised protein [Chlamydia trachomatis]|nr:Uncharacterised protein [Chlamydia trachomatis]
MPAISVTLEVSKLDKSSSFVVPQWKNVHFIHVHFAVLNDERSKVGTWLQFANIASMSVEFSQVTPVSLSSVSPIQSLNI